MCWSEEGESPTWYIFKSDVQLCCSMNRQEPLHWSAVFDCELEILRGCSKLLS